MSYTIAAIMDDCKTTVETLVGNGQLDVKAVHYPPPLTWPAFGPFVQIEYGGAEIEQGSDEVTIHTIEFWCLMPLKGNAAAINGEYAQVISIAHQIHRAFITNVLIGADDDAAVASNGIIGKPDYVGMGEVRCIRCMYTLHCVTSEEVAATV